MDMLFLLFRKLKRIEMSKQKISPVLTWIYFFLSIGSLISSGIYLRNALITSALKDILPAAIFALLGILWVFMFGEGRSNNANRL
jgi:hypothetical protein